MQPNATASTADFEFQALREAAQYRAALIREFSRFLVGDVIEIGAGIGQMTELLRRHPGVRQCTAIEPDAAFCALHRSACPGHRLIEGTIDDLDPASRCDAILSINVLEHIEDDGAELRKYASLLKSRRGALCLFVPARPEIHAPLDRDFGHFRRYTRPGLRDRLEKAGFRIERLHYFNVVGYFAWWLNFCLLKKRRFDARAVRFFDRVIFPPVHWLESRVVRPPFGQSLLAVATVREG